MTTAVSVNPARSLTSTFREKLAASAFSKSTPRGSSTVIWPSSEIAYGWTSTGVERTVKSLENASTAALPLSDDIRVNESSSIINATESASMAPVRIQPPTVTSLRDESILANTFGVDAKGAENVTSLPKPLVRDQRSITDPVTKASSSMSPSTAAIVFRPDSITT